jgi:hypothetical protein
MLVLVLGDENRHSYVDGDENGDGDSVGSDDDEDQWLSWSRKGRR